MVFLELICRLRGGKSPEEKKQFISVYLSERRTQDKLNRSSHLALDLIT